jgi:hypothetical protein
MEREEDYTSFKVDVGQVSFLERLLNFRPCPGVCAWGYILSIAFGCLDPLVSRPRKNYYTIIGDAYVHGFMHDEAIKLLEKGELKVEQFEVH